MGFALWIDQDVAWAKGTHEYRPMGVAVVSVTDLFAPRDFRPRRRAPSSRDRSFVGYFASIGQLNAHLRVHRRAPASRRSSPALPFLE